MAYTTIANGASGTKYRRVNAGDTWAAIIAGAYQDGDAELDGESSHTIRIWAHTTANWKELSRAPLSFDLTSLAGETVTIVAVRTKIYSKYDDLGITPNINAYGRTAPGNYEDFGAVAFCDFPVSYANITPGSTESFYLNATGLAAVQAALGGTLLLGIRNANYDVAATEPAWSTGNIASEVVLYNLNADILIYYESVPVLEAWDAYDITRATANLLVDVVDDGELTTNVRFEYGETDAYGTFTDWQNDVGEGFVNQEITGLDPSTVYHFRGIATNAKGTVYGDDKTFTTVTKGSNFAAIIG
uniref:Fibronectin type-III domain-containing protein n=1 Tax=viral metagenome TaxID=1070528 RepID=A0A6M3KMP0_9ZZZZ